MDKTTAIVLNTIIGFVIAATSWTMGTIFTEMKLEDEQEKIVIEKTNETNEYNVQQDISRLTEEINELKQQMSDNDYTIENLEQQITNKDNKISDLEKQLEEEKETKETNNITYDEYIAGNDSDNDGDDQYDNEYADPDRIYTDENGIIIYDDRSYRNNYPTYDNSSSGSGGYYIARGNSYYHNSPDCKFLQGAQTDEVTKEQAISNGKHECNCIKY